jgi:hypothetical protein
MESETDSLKISDPKLTKPQALEIILQKFIEEYSKLYPDRMVTTRTKYGEDNGLPFGMFGFMGVEIIMDAQGKQLVRIVPATPEAEAQEVTP